MSAARLCPKLARTLALLFLALVDACFCAAVGAFPPAAFLFKPAWDIRVFSVALRVDFLAALALGARDGRFTLVAVLTGLTRLFLCAVRLSVRRVLRFAATALFGIYLSLTLRIGFFSGSSFCLTLPKWLLTVIGCGFCLRCIFGKPILSPIGILPKKNPITKANNVIAAGTIVSSIYIHPLMRKHP